MLKGDLTSTPIAPLLLDLAASAATGCLNIAGLDGDDAQLYLKSGQVYAVTVPGMRPQLGAKLVSSGALAPEALAHALDAQRNELQGWRLGELLVHLGYVDQPVVEAFVKEQIYDAMWELIRWTRGRWAFRENLKTREEVAPPVTVANLLRELRARGFEWETISQVVHGPNAVPVLSTRGTGEAQTTLDNDAWSMLCKIDGVRTVADLAREGGYTLFEAGNVIVALVRAGLIDIEEDVDLAGAAPYGASTLASALAGDPVVAADEVVEDSPEGPLSRLVRLVTHVATGEAATAGAPDAADPDAADPDAADPDAADPEDANHDVAIRARVLRAPLDDALTPMADPVELRLHRQSTESFAASIARVSTALSDVLGPPPEFESDAASAATDLRAKRSRARARAAAADPEWERQKRHRAAAAAELAAAHALAESEQPRGDAVSWRTVTSESAGTPETTLPPAEPVDGEDEVAGCAIVGTEPVEAERIETDEAVRLEAERREAERLEAEKAEAERLAAEQAARLEAERAAAEQAGRDEAARLEAERLAAEEAERAEARRLNAERVAAQAARLEEERRAAEEAARQEAERAEAERAELQRLAAEQLAAEQSAADQFAIEQEVRRQAAAEQEAATALLMELSALSPSAPADEQADDQGEIPDQPAHTPEAPEDDAETAAPAAQAGRGHIERWAVTADDAPDRADTAALLRELSSLGGDDVAPRPPVTPTPRSPSRAPKPATTDKKQRKKIGLFGL